MCFLLVGCASPTWATESVATLFVTGNSFGEYQPCPTCGGYALGGLGRRAGLFSRTRSDNPGALYISCGYEFVSYIKRREVRPELMEPLAKAYAMLNYDLGVVLPIEASAMQVQGVVPPEAFRLADGVPWSRVFERRGLKIGVLVFPAKANAYASVSKLLKSKVIEAARMLRPSVDVLVGVSTWGERDELRFADEYPAEVDVLMGAGPGTGYGVRVAGDGRTVWVRPPYDGRGVMRFDIMALPGADGQWRNGEQFSFEALELRASEREVVAVTNLFSWF